MNEYDATELAYKHGKEDGRKEAAVEIDRLKYENEKLRGKLRKYVRQYHICTECIHLKREPIPFTANLTEIVCEYGDGCAPVWKGLIEDAEKPGGIE